LITQIDPTDKSVGYCQLSASPTFAAKPRKAFRTSAGIAGVFHQNCSPKELTGHVDQKISGSSSKQV
jgi:hypothetical protein